MTQSAEICGTDCGLNATLRIISGKWKPLVLFFLRDGAKRYGELKRLIPGVSDKVLIQSLKDLEADQVLVRNDYKEVPPRVDYTLSPLGSSLASAIIPLCTWGTEHAAQLAGMFAERDALHSTDAGGNEDGHQARPPGRRATRNLEGNAGRAPQASTAR